MSITERESKIYSEIMAEGRERLKNELETLDEELSRRRDRKRYRDKGRRKTVMGEVEREDRASG